ECETIPTRIDQQQAGPTGTISLRVEPPLRDQVHPCIDADTDGARRHLVDTAALPLPAAGSYLRHRF
ncbi:MAG TPA: hypothetical protein VNT27_16625, partial [Propionibacteriaceae bacterium]|nr:hypothetical protein [Propionibacteriaceae bacterium]